MAEWPELAPQHQWYLERRGVSPETAAGRGYRSATRKAGLEELGFGVAQRRVPALVIPIWAPWPAENPAVYQIHADDPRRSAEGKALKFEFPTKATMHLDVHPALRDAVGNPKLPLIITEGVVKADSAASHLAACTIAVAGVWNWRGRNDEGGLTALADWEQVALNDRAIIICFDSDIMLKRSVYEALTRLGRFLERRANSELHYCYLPSGPEGQAVGLDDWLVAHAGPDAEPGRLTRELAALCEDRPRTDDEPGPVNVPYQPPERRTLAEVEAVFGKWLAEPDVGAVRLVLAVMVANRSGGDPVWVLIIAPPSSGKTEILMSLAGLPDITLAGRLTVASLLSGTSAKERTGDATGGLLRVIGTRGVLLSKDFGAILAMNRDARGELLQALRDIFDGHYDRPVGTDGGRQLVWEGRCGFVGGATEAIDGHHTVIAALGDRYVSLRLTLPDGESQAAAAINGGGDEDQMRHELAEAVAGFLGHIDCTMPAISNEVRDRLAALAALAVRCRSTVERDTYSSREIVNVPRSEQPARIAKQLAKVYAGLLCIGCKAGDAWQLVTRVALDSMPSGRRHVLEHLVLQQAGLATNAIGVAVALPTTVVKRHLEDLESHGVTKRTAQGQGKADLWEMSEWTRQRWDVHEPAASEPEKFDTRAGRESEPEKYGTHDSPSVVSVSDPSLKRGECKIDFSGLPLPEDAAASNGNGQPTQPEADPWVEELF